MALTLTNSGAGCLATSNGVRMINFLTSLVVMNALGVAKGSFGDNTSQCDNHSVGHWTLVHHITVHGLNRKVSQHSEEKSKRHQQTWGVGLLAKESTESRYRRSHFGQIPGVNECWD